MSDSVPQKSEFRPRDRWLLFAFILGPMAAFGYQSLAYTLVPEAYANGSLLLLHGLAAAFFLAALAGASIAWRIHQQCDAEEEERTRWVATVAAALDVWSAIVIIAFELANLIT